MKILVISADYPDPNFIYGDVFVHTRLKAYQRHADVLVLGYNSGLQVERRFVYENIPVNIFSNLDPFYAAIEKFDPDIIAAHLINHIYIDFLLWLKKPLVIFVHGYEALSWKRRLMNYNSLGAIPYLLPYVTSNAKQLRKIKNLALAAKTNKRIQFVFVSKWLSKAVQEDLGISIENSTVIPNGINTDLFVLQQKKPDHRRKILLLRSFKARNYANDIAIDAIKLVSKKSFFRELEIAIYGEGYLFGSLTAKLACFPNVKLYNTFLENYKIPGLHKNFGVFLCPSRLDTQGVSMCEAMASGLVPITSNVGGIPEYLEDNISGFTTSNAAQVAQKIEELYTQPDKFLEMSRNARRAIVSKCNLSETIRKEISLFNSMICQRSTRNVGTPWQNGEYRR